LRQALGFPPVDVQLCDSIQQLALPDDDIIEWLGVDVRGLFPLNSHNWNVHEKGAGEYWVYHDEWGITHRRPKPDGLYYTLTQAPLEAPDLSAQVIKSPFAGIFEMAQRIVGMENCLIMMASNETLVGALFDRLLELKLAFWEMALPHLADVVDVIAEFDDYGTQASQLISPRMFRQQVKPHLKILFERIKQLAPDARRFFHSCGNVRPLLPDFIEMGIEILNPVHVRATSMEPSALKRDFGDALVFWGGGVDTQGVLPMGTPQQVKDDVRRNIEALAPGGGFVFNTVHNIQADVPPQNIVAMWEALQEYGV
jgi:uroporphyrinogen decarboxylase